MGTKMIGEKEEWAKCDDCTEYVKGCCTVPHCPYMIERIDFGQIQYHHIVKDSFSEFRNRFFKKRLRELVGSFVGEWYLSPCHKDRYSYLKEDSALLKNKRNERFAVLYILSADEELWTRAKSHVNRNHSELYKAIWKESAQMATHCIRQREPL